MAKYNVGDKVIAVERLNATVLSDMQGNLWDYHPVNWTRRSPVDSTCNKVSLVWLYSHFWDLTVVEVEEAEGELETTGQEEELRFIPAGSGQFYEDGEFSVFRDDERFVVYLNSHDAMAWLPVSVRYKKLKNALWEALRLANRENHYKAVALGNARHGAE